MKEYFKRLRTHAGLEMATMMSLLGFFAGASNQTVKIWWHGGLFGLIFVGGICWLIVLFSNFKK